MKTDRLIGIIELLLQQEKATAPELARVFRVSRRTISRDIDELCQAGFPLVTAQGQNGGIAIMDGYHVDRSLLNPEGMEAVLSGEKRPESVSVAARPHPWVGASSSSQYLTPDDSFLIDLSSWYQDSQSFKIKEVRAAVEG